MAFTRSLASHETFHAGTIWLSVHSYWTSFFSLHIPKELYLNMTLPIPNPNRTKPMCNVIHKAQLFFILCWVKNFFHSSKIIICTFCWLTDKFEVAQKLSKKNRKLFDLLLRWIGALLSREFEKRLLKVSALSAHFENKLRLLIINYFFVCSSFHIFLRIVMSSSRSFSTR